MVLIVPVSGYRIVCNCSRASSTVQLTITLCSTEKRQHQYFRVPFEIITTAPLYYTTLRNDRHWDLSTHTGGKPLPI